MSFLSKLFFTDIRTAIIGSLIGYVVYKLSKIYIQIWSLPPGPLPLPIVGNILSTTSSKQHWDNVIKNMSKKYGPVFTFWMGSNPYVIITDIDIAREVFRTNNFTGRPDSYFGSFFSNDKYQDVIFNTYGHSWEALRRVTHSAVQKYSTNDKLVYLVTDCVDSIIELILNEEGVNSEFNPINYIYLLFLNIISRSALGKSYTFEDNEFKFLKYCLRDLGREYGVRKLLWEFSPIIRWFDKKMVNKYQNTFMDLLSRIRYEFNNHYKDYDQSIERDFCDALISTKNDALREGKESVPYLTDENLASSIFDLFFAGTETSQQTFQWLLLFLCYYPEIQKKLRQEIESEIGDRIPTHEDRYRCHYVMAFIAETLRLRNVAPGGVPHCPIVDSKIGNYNIGKGNSIMVYQGMILTDEKHWKNAQEFSPERFLENGQYMTTRPKAFIPFGVGRRVCLGEKLAIADLFLVLVIFLQKTANYDLILGMNSGIEPDPKVVDSYCPFEYKINLRSK